MAFPAALKGSSRPDYNALLGLVDPWCHLPGLSGQSSNHDGGCWIAKSRTMAAPRQGNLVEKCSNTTISSQPSAY
jgi:hypothetical protein